MRTMKLRVLKLRSPAWPSSSHAVHAAPCDILEIQQRAVDHALGSQDTILFKYIISSLSSLTRWNFDRCQEVRQVLVKHSMLRQQASAVVAWMANAYQTNPTGPRRP